MQSKPISFMTFAPGELVATNGLITSVGLAELWRSAPTSSSIETPSIDKAIGVYIISSKDGETTLPWYVGKTDKGFKKRFDAHLRREKTFARILSKAQTKSLFVTFIGRLTPGRKLKRARKPGALTKTKAIKSIDRLEFDLIRACHLKNRGLLNSSNRVFHDGFSVPGFVGPDADEDSLSAKSLRDLLHV